MAKEVTILAVFSSYDQANAAVEELHSVIEPTAISVLAQEQAVPSEPPPPTPPLEVDEAGIETVQTGAAIGGIAGLLSGISAIVIPGLGPLFAIGPLFNIIGTAALGTGLGATAGAAIGGLLGLPKDEVDRYVEALERGNILIAIETSLQNREKIEGILKKHQARQLLIRD
jgi:hypothetical protein